ncbi:MAG: 7-cyano-7-deazaguanine synthase [Candidatus Omnitrophica bacterium]|nr:7-cyano-7-deazaguanine synthase [Candidatus Omnitrophota bacterium]
MGRSVVALVSGGVESLGLVVRLLRSFDRVVPVYIRCGLRWESAELWWLRRWLGELRHPRLRPLVILELPVRSIYGRHWSVGRGSVPSRTSRDAAVYLPGRNVLLLSVAAIYASQRGIGRLALGTLGSNPFGDATPRFFRQLSNSLQQALGKPIQIMTPLRRFTKAHVVGSNQPWHLTFSCLQPRGRQHCGRCNKCAERQRAFRAVEK